MEKEMQKSKLENKIKEYKKALAEGRELNERLRKQLQTVTGDGHELQELRTSVSRLEQKMSEVEAENMRLQRANDILQRANDSLNLGRVAEHVQSTAPSYEFRAATSIPLDVPPAYASITLSGDTPTPTGRRGFFGRFGRR